MKGTYIVPRILCTPNKYYFWFVCLFTVWKEDDEILTFFRPHFSPVYNFFLLLSMTYKFYMMLSLSVSPNLIHTTLPHRLYPIIFDTCPVQNPLAFKYLQLLFPLPEMCSPTGLLLTVFFKSQLKYHLHWDTLANCPLKSILTHPH